jgi:hypothetical protein
MELLNATIENDDLPINESLVELLNNTIENNDLPINESLVAEGENIMLDINDTWMKRTLNNNSSNAKLLNNNSDALNDNSLNNNIDNINNLLKGNSSEVLVKDQRMLKIILY